MSLLNSLKPFAIKSRIRTWRSLRDHDAQKSEAPLEIDFTIFKSDRRLKAELAMFKTKIDRINCGFTEGSIDIAEFKELKTRLVIQKTDLEQQIVALEGSKFEAARTGPEMGFGGKYA
jgi:hypothetical protein